MSYARAILRLLILAGVTTAYYLRWLAGVPFVSRSPHRARDWRNRNFRGWARTAAGAIGMTINVRNQPPTGSFLMVSNHLSYVDIIALASQSDCAFIAKSEVAKWPVIGSLCNSAGTIFIDRQSKRDIHRVTQQIEQTLQNGLGVVLFAEGTSTNGREVLPFKTSLLEFASRNKVPVHYAGIGYVVPAGETPAEESVCWWGEMTFPDHLFRLLQLPSFEANLTYGTEPIVSGDRRVLAATLRSAVSAQLRPARVAPDANVTARPEARIIANCIKLLEQASDLIERVDDDVYSGTSLLSPRASIGGHLRHLLDFYQSFLAGVEAGNVNYNQRQRAVRVERDRGFAGQRLSETIAALLTLPPLDGNKPLLVSAEQGEVAAPVWCPSSVLRELDFLQSHTVHHYALVAMLLRLHEIDPGEEFGVAPSTLNHWKEEMSCAQ